MSFIISRVESQTERSALTIIYNQIDYLHVISVYGPDPTKFWKPDPDPTIFFKTDPDPTFIWKLDPDSTKTPWSTPLLQSAEAP